MIKLIVLIIGLSLIIIGCKSSSDNKLLHATTTYEDGTVKTDFYIRNNKKDSLYKEYYPTGVIKNKSMYKNGFTTYSYNFYESGCLKSIFNYDSKENGEFKIYFNGCDSENILKIKGIFKNGKKEGIQYTFNEFGDTVLIQEYKDDILVNK
jgi:antitoxin component YwqK of YwqJK toxin-antitoxin module